MPVVAKPCQAEWEEVRQVTVVRFAVRRDADLQEILELFELLDRLADGEEGRRILLNFGDVEGFTSYPLGKVVALDRKLRDVGGRLALCDLTPVVAEAVDILKLRRRLNIYATEQEALESF